jgi:hypothetical protein
MTTKTKKKKPYVGTYRQYIGRIVERIMQEAMSARDAERQIPLDGFLTQESWDRVKKLGTDEFLKAAKAKS